MTSENVTFVFNCLYSTEGNTQNRSPDVTCIWKVLEERRLPHCLLSNVSRTTPVHVFCVSPGTRSTRVIRHATGTRQTRPTTICLNGREVWLRDSGQTHGEPSSQPTSAHAIARPATASDWVSARHLVDFFFFLGLFHIFGICASSFQCPRSPVLCFFIFNCFSLVSFRKTPLLVFLSFGVHLTCSQYYIFFCLSRHMA